MTVEANAAPCPTSARRAQQMTAALWDSRHSPPDTWTGGRTSRSSRTVCPPSYPSGRFSLITLRTALSAARRFAGSAARYSATVEAVMLATIPAAVRGRELYGSVGGSQLYGRTGTRLGGRPGTESGNFGRP